MPAAKRFVSRRDRSHSPKRQLKSPLHRGHRSRTRPVVSAPPCRLHKLLADWGLGSRRQIETWIQAGRLRVNAQLATLGICAQMHDTITLDGQRLKPPRGLARTRVLLYHKPEGRLCTVRDPQQRPTVFEQLPPLSLGRWIMVGRLDRNTSGLLLFTNQGELAHQLMHPRSQIERVYAVRIRGQATPEQCQQLCSGVLLDSGGSASFTELKDSGGTDRNHWYQVTLTEGKNREVHRMWAAVGLEVSRLIRIQFGPILLERTLPKGGHRELDSAAVRALRAAIVSPTPR